MTNDKLEKRRDYEEADLTERTGHIYFLVPLPFGTIGDFTAREDTIKNEYY